MKNLGIFFFILALAFIACRKDINDVNEVTTTPDPVFLDNYVPTYIQVNGDLTGFTIDENNEPVHAATVKVGNLTAITDPFGHFFFTNIDMNAAGTIVKVEKEGYFAGSRRFTAVANDENRIKIELLTKNFNQNFASESGGTIDLNQGGSIIFAPNSIRDAAGNLYTGEVKVASAWLDPSKVRTLNQMPGNLFGVNNLGEEVALGTYGMVAVELESETGEPLNILDGQTATIRFPLPGSIASDAPATIPLWSYNEEFGVWAEEGSASKENGYYVGEVSHFSFWNCDAPFPLVEFAVTFTDEDGNPLENYLGAIGFLDSIYARSCYTSENGVLSGKIPANEVLTLSIFGLCNEVIYSQQIGPFSVAVDLGTIAIPASVLEVTTLAGELVDCDEASIQNGVVIASYGGGNVYEYVNGEPFDFIFSSCAGIDDIEVVGYDLTELVQSEIELATANEETDLGTIDVCDIALNNYISFTIDGGQEQVFINGYGVATDTATLVGAFSTINPDENIFLGFNGYTVGDYGGNTSPIDISAPSHGVITHGNISILTVTSYGNVGEPIIGTFSGTIGNLFPPISVAEIAGEFSVVRTQ